MTPAQSGASLLLSTDLLQRRFLGMDWPAALADTFPLQAGVGALLAIAEACEERLVALLGSPAYYRRFDFRPATELGITARDPGWDEYFQARRLTGAPVQGTFRYAAPFTRL